MALSTLELGAARRQRRRRGCAARPSSINTLPAIPAAAFGAALVVHFPDGFLVAAGAPLAADAAAGFVAAAALLLAFAFVVPLVGADAGVPFIPRVWVREGELHVKRGRWGWGTTSA